MANALMWGADRVPIKVIEIEGDVMVVQITTPQCVIDMMGEVLRLDRTLHMV